MPGKSEIMRAVREGLDNLEVVKPWTDTEGSKAVKTKLCEIGREFEFKVGAKRNEVKKPTETLENGSTMSLGSNTSPSLSPTVC